MTADTKQLSVDISQAATKAGSDAAGNIGSAMTNGLRAAGGLAKSLGSSVATGLTVATGAATAFGVQAFKTASRVGEMDASLRALAKANGLSYETMQQSVAAIRKQGIEAGTAQNLVAQFARNQLDLSKSTELARVAQDAAVISGRNSTEVLADLTHGITTQNSQVLRNAGLNVQAGQAVSKYAASVGKSVKDLTDAERSQAVLNAVLESGKTVAGAYAEAMTEPGKVLRSFARVTDDIKLSVGQGLVKAFGPLILQSYDLAKAFSAAVGPGGALAPIFDSIGVAVGKLVAPLTAIVGRWAEWLAALKPEQLQGVLKIIERFGPAFLAGAAGLSALVAPQLLGSVPILGGVLKSLTGPIQLVVGGLTKMGGSALAAVPGIGKLGASAGLLPAAMNPVGAAIVGIVAAIAAMMVASKDFREGVLAMGQALWTGLQPALSSIWQLVKTFGLALWEIVKAIGDALGPALKNLAPLLQTIGELFGTNLAGSADGASSSLGAIVPVITGVIKVIGVLLDVITKVLVPLIQVPLKMGVMVSVAIQAVQPIRLLGQAIEWLTGVVTKLWHWITGNSPGLIPALGQLGGVAGTVAGTLTGVLGKALSGLVGVAQQAHGAVTSALSGMASAGRTAGSSMVEGLKAGLSAAKSMGGWIGSNVTGPVVGFIKSGFGVFSPSTITITVGGDMVEGLKRGLEAARKMGGWLQSNVAGPVLGALKSGLDAAAMTPVGQQMIAGLQQGLSAASQMGGWLQSNVAGPILGGIKSAFGIGSPSRYTMPMGEDLMAGVEVGMARAADHLEVPDLPALVSPLSGDLGGLAGLGQAGGGSVINVYPSAGMDERALAALVSRELAWAAAGGAA